MVAVFILLSTIAVSIFINRIAAKALILTGLSEDVAVFQARSIVTGTGFTTHEAESIVNHPVRRRLVMPLMVLQNAGLVTVISTFVLSFVDTGTTMIALQRGLILFGGIGVLIFLSQNEWVEHQLEKLIDWLLETYTNLKIVDIHTLLNLHEGFTVSRFMVDENTWLSNKKLEDLKLQDEGILVLCIENKEGEITCTPTGDEQISAGDELTVFAEEDNVSELKNRLNDESDKKDHDKIEGNRRIDMGL